MKQLRGLLTPEERARITELQDLLIERFIAHRKAVAEGQEEHVKTVEAQIDSLLREKEHREMGGCRLGLAAQQRGDWLPHHTSNEAE